VQARSPPLALWNSTRTISPDEAKICSDSLLLTLQRTPLVESQACLASAKNAVEQEVGNVLSVCHEIWRTIELVLAGLEIGLHFRPFCAAFATWPSGLSGRLGYVRLQRLTSCVYP
jgi:hypothetical protein